MNELAHTPMVPTVRTRWKSFWITLPIFFALMLSWALASPMMSSPDEPAHAIRAAAVARGDFTGTLSKVEPGTSEVTAPQYLADSMRLTCYRGSILDSAACQSAANTTNNDLVTAYTTATLNTPVFYAAVGWPTLFLDGYAAMYSMRALVSLICAFLLAVTVMALVQLTRNRWAVLGVVVAVTPMVLFLSGTINPNAVEIAASAASLALLLLVLKTASPGRILWERIALLTLSVYLLVNTRSLSMFWVLLICIVALALGQWRTIRAVFVRPVAWVGTAVMGALIGAALWWFLIPKGLTQEFTSVGRGTPWFTAFSTSLDRTFDLAQGWIGVLGWLDTPVPGLTMSIWILAIGALLVSAVTLSSLRSRLVLIAMLVTVVLLPAIVQANLAEDWGYVWQGRYVLALVVCVLIVAGVTLDDQFDFSWSMPLSRLVTTMIVLLSVAQFAAFAWALKRYTVGLSWDATWVDMLLHPAWQPPFGVIPLLLGYAVVLAVGSIVLLRFLRRSESASAPQIP